MISNVFHKRIIGLWECVVYISEFRDVNNIGRHAIVAEIGL